MKVRDLTHSVVGALFLTFTLITSASAQSIKVDLKTLKEIGPGRTEAVPRVKVEIGSYTTTTDDRGRGSIAISPGEHLPRVTGGCQVSSVSVVGSVRVSGGSPSQPLLDFPLPSNQTPTVTFLMRCDTDLVPGMVRVKIATRASCTDDPNGAVQMQAGVAVRIGDKTYSSNESGVIEIDLPAGQYPIGGTWLDYTFGYVTQNGLRIRTTEGGQPMVRLDQKVETLEVRMLTCDQTGQEKARAEIIEIGVTGLGPGSIDVERSKASGKGFVGMKLRDGDKLKINGTAKLRWIGRAGTINFDDPSRVSLVQISPLTPPTGVAAKQSSTLQILSGFSGFFFPKADEPEFKFQASTHSVAVGLVIGPGGKLGGKIGQQYYVSSPPAVGDSGATRFTVQHNDRTQVSIVKAIEGTVEVTPANTAFPRFYLRAGQQAEISPNGVNGPPADAQGGINIKTSKSVYAPDEPIQVEYSNPKASGWDWVVIAQPAKRPLAGGQMGSVAPAYSLQFEPANNQFRDVRSSTTFPGLPEGDYEARYISWDGGNNLPKASFPFKVGKGNSPQDPPRPPVRPPTVDGNLPPSPSKDLTGLWKNPGGNVTYRLRQIGNRLYWGVDGVSNMSFANIYYGDIKGNTVDGIWIDLPGSPYVGDGKIFLRIESDCRLVKTSEVNHYANEIWVRKNSPCDGGGPVGPAPTGDLTGLWKNPGGNAVYRFRQVGNKLHWGIDAVPQNSFANKFEGEVNGNLIEGRWVDLPGSPIVAGTLYLKVESECRIVKTGEINHYGAETWVKQGSTCDTATGLSQKTNAAGATKTNTPGSDRVSVSDPFAKKPPLTPPGNKTGGATKKPKVEEIPDDEITVDKNNRDNEAFINETTTKGERKPPTGEEPKQPKQPQRPPTTDGGSTGQTGGTTAVDPCKSGIYGITGRLQFRVGEKMYLDWNAPADHALSDWFLINVAGTNNLAYWGYLDAKSSCGRKDGIYNIPVGQYDVYLFQKKESGNMRPVFGPVRFTVTP